MKKRLLISGLLATTIVLTGMGYQRYLDLRKQAGLDSDYPAVMATPPGSLIPD